MLQHCVAFREHFIIDGYNVIHQNDELSRALKNYGWAAATERLISLCLAVLRSDSCMTIVFDGNGERNDVQMGLGMKNFRVIFSSSHFSADSVIEKIVIGTKKPTICTVVTNDSAVLRSIFANNANMLSGKDFFRYIGASNDCFRGMQERQRKSGDWKLNTAFDDLKL